MEIYIYTLKCPNTNKIRYVGQTNNPKRRLNKHINHAKSLVDNRHINNWIRSLKSSPIMEIIETCDYSIRNDREEYWINFYTEKDYNLCNHSKGGSGAGIDNKNCEGRIISKETRDKISKANRNRVFNKSQYENRIYYSKEIYQYDKNMILINIYKSIKEACIITGLNRVTIRRNIQGISKSRDFIWSDKLL